MVSLYLINESVRGCHLTYAEARLKSTPEVTTILRCASAIFSLQAATASTKEAQTAPGV